MRQHRQAMDCRDCESFLQLGIDAFDWIVRADQVLRGAMYQGFEGFDHNEAEDAIRALCRSWLAPCTRANEWAVVQNQRDFRVDNLDRFRQCCAEMQAIVNAQDAKEEPLPDALADLQDEAIQEHLNGETAEFV